MPLYRLMLEDHCDVFPVSLQQVQAAVRKLAGSSGPTFLNLRDGDGNWAQAGGMDGRYRVEVRDVYGEGFRHWMAALPGCTDRTNTVVYYRNRCTEKKHPRRSCPLQATVANVLSLADVLSIMTAYWEDGQRSPQYSWDDISDEWIKDELDENGTGIKEIKPKQQGGLGA